MKPMWSPIAEAHAPRDEVAASRFILVLAPPAFFQLGISPPKPSLLDRLGTDAHGGVSGWQTSIFCPG